jgi:hypothetical protein
MLTFRPTLESFVFRGFARPAQPTPLEIKGVGQGALSGILHNRPTSFSGWAGQLGTPWNRRFTIGN